MEETLEEHQQGLFNRQEEKEQRGKKLNEKSVLRTWRIVLQAEMLLQLQWKQGLT